MIRFRIRSLRWRQEHSGWSVFSAIAEGESEETTLVGVLPPLEREEEVEVEGAWMEHPKYGRQFKATRFQIAPPQGAKSVVRFLASGHFRTIRTKRAEAIVAHFGPLALEILRLKPKRIAEVAGFGKKSVERFIEDWDQLSTTRDALFQLLEAGIGGALSQRICKHYGEETLEILRSDPYQLCDTIFGVGFARADKIARTNGVPIDAPSRMQAALIHRLREATTEGHTYLPRDELLYGAAELLLRGVAHPQQIEEEEILLDDFRQTLLEELPRALSYLLEERKLVESEKAVYLAALHRDELKVAEWVRVALEQRPLSLHPEELKETLEKWGTREGLQLDDLQRDAVLQAARTRLFLLTGGPGTGKTTALRGLVHLLHSAGRELLLAAPTGRAARRMTEVTGVEAKTIHRLLDYEPINNKFLRDSSRPYRNTTLIIDETSMVDLPLMAAVLSALDPACSLVLVGDANQLPSIGPGTLFRDLLSHPTIPSTHLQTIHRQGADSSIPLNAMRINRGEMPLAAAPGEPEGNFHLIPTHSAEESREALIRLVVEEIPRRFGLHPVDDVQVLIPMHKGILGTEELNRELRERLNPEGRRFRVGPVDLRTGDKVMQFKNDYENNIFNGDLGRVVGFESSAQSAQIDFGELVSIGGDKIDKIGLAYACTIHKSQGSEYPAVVVALDRSQNRMLQRTLLYTAITRAKKQAFLIGPPAAIAQAVRHEPTTRRYSRLPELLRQGEEFMDLLRG